MTAKLNSTSMAKNATKNLVYIAVCIAMIVITSQITIPLAPVPISLGLLGIFLTCALLGGLKGGIAVGIYVLMGIIGIPVFAGFKGGVAAFLGATGGFIMGYLTVPFILGIICKLFGYNWISLLVSLTISLIMVYLLGTLWFMNYLNTSFKAATSATVIPFIVGDLLKISITLPLSLKLRKILRVKNNPIIGNIFKKKVAEIQL